MASGKRASMREGPLAALFRKTETEGLEDRDGAVPAPAEPPRAEAVEPPAPEPVPAPAPAAAPRAEEPRVPTPQERLRHAFSSDLPENMMSPPSHTVPPPSASDYQWGSAPQESTPGQPLLRVVGVGGGGVN